MKNNLHLLVIDPQNDFCDLPTDYLPFNSATQMKYSPALPVTGAHADMQRLAGLIQQAGGGLTGISVTIDSHHRVDIAHPTYWKTANGMPVNAFTQISAAEVREKKLIPRCESMYSRTLNYLEALEARGRYQHMVWPVHCEIGSWGNNIHTDVLAAYTRWEENEMCQVNKVIKGTNPWTEHYSAIMAEVPDEDDLKTQMNQSLIDLLANADQVYIAGEAGSHCVKATVEHIVENIGKASLGKLVLITDCMSPVTGFENQYEQFVRDMVNRNVKTAKVADVLPELIANSRR